MPDMEKCKLLFAGASAGIVTGLFGAGGGMVLVPMLRASEQLPDDVLFPSSLSVILPICLVSLMTQGLGSGQNWLFPLPFFLGGCLGGILAGKYGDRIPSLWLHKGLGLMILWGGIRYLW